MPQKFSSTCSSIKEIAPRILEVVLQLQSSVELAFLPGQFIMVLVDSETTTSRAYSIASESSPTHSVRLVVSLKPGGVGSRYYENLSVGDSVTFFGSAGFFVLPEELPNNINFVCTGTGVVAFIPMLRELVNLGFAGNITLLFGSRFEKDVFYEELLKDFQKELSNFNFTVCLSQEPHQEDLQVSRRYSRVTENLDLLNFTNSIFYLSGNPNMVPEVEKLLISRHISQELIYSEKY